MARRDRSSRLPAGADVDRLATGIDAGQDLAGGGLRADLAPSAPVNRMRPVHLGEVLREEYLMPLGMSPHALAQALKVPPSRVNDIVWERRGITVDTAMRLGRFFGGDVQTWMNLQTASEIKTAEANLAPRIAEEVTPRAV